jgi:hypothetical protein
VICGASLAMRELHEGHELKSQVGFSTSWNDPSGVTTIDKGVD